MLLAAMSKTRPPVAHSTMSVWRTPKIVVVNMGYSGGEAQVYVRCTGDLDLAPMIPRMRDRGLSSGGKSEVLGVIVPKLDLENVMGDILGYLEDPGAARYDDQ